MFSGCESDSTSASAGDGEVGVQFKTEVQQPKSTDTGFYSNTVTSEHDTLFVSGSNGTLRITDIQFIVAEFELEPREADGDSTEFEEISSGPVLVDLPLNSNGIFSLNETVIPAGFYEELEFEIENLEIDEDDEEASFLALQDEIRALFPQWPVSASMIIIGDFISAQGDTTAFTTFAEAEIEVEREFEPAIEITDANRAQILTIPITPSVWFSRANNTVLNLAEYDYETTEELLEFEIEFENGISEIEFNYEDDDDDDNDD